MKIDAASDDLVEQLRRLLAPGEIELAGLIVRTTFGREEELDMHEATLEIGELVAEHAGVDDWYIYSGNDDPEFALNQHQGLRIPDDAFVWECQHLLRDGTFDIVMYYEADLDQERLLADLQDAGYDVTGVDAPDT